MSHSVQVTAPEDFSSSDSSGSQSLSDSDTTDGSSSTVSSEDSDASTENTSGDSVFVWCSQHTLTPGLVLQACLNGS